MKEHHFAKHLCMTVLVVFVLAAVAFFSFAESRYVVNGRDMEDMSIEELYEMEDYLVLTLRKVFIDTSTKDGDGNTIGTYVINRNTGKFHYPDCYSSLAIGSDRQFITCDVTELISQGWKPCGQCKPYYDIR